jgi:NitT/TauT family transport system permease protein
LNNDEPSITNGKAGGSKQSHSTLWILFSVGGFFLVWAVTAYRLDDNSLPGPLAVWESVITEWQSGELLFHLGATLIRVAAAFAVAMFIGSAIGIWMGMNRSADRILSPWLILLLNVPALVIIVLSYIWFGLNEAAAIGAVALNKIPNVAVTLREGARSLSPEFAEMATVYRFGAGKRLLHVVLPQLQPFFAAATRSGIALIWKIVLIVELLGRSNGVGFQIHLYFQLFDVATILAYTLAFVVVMLIVEYLMLQPLDRQANRWRGAHG